ncbi:electron transfer DM13 [Actinoplanes teichomyceticus]|uniref:Electron transfer DM13 n=1 Tax=Actinoplanes teichomyceticus TaxID=1867 RepID=A0A561VI83_ACTTI|nr:electron transfer DM13 [Actinoplanes teichomyceticus]
MILGSGALTRTVIRRLFTRSVTLTVVAVLGIAAAGALYWFQPWRLFTDTVVTDTLSVVPSAGPQPSSASAAPTRDLSPVVIAEGPFVSHEHDTSGTARIVRNADGSHQLELAGLDTSDGPDLRVWLSDQPVRTGPAGWGVFDDGEHAELGRLKGNHGDQVYRFPDAVDPQAWRSVSIWCKRFAVSFGAAQLSVVSS